MIARIAGAMLLALLWQGTARAQEQVCEALLQDGVRDYSGQAADYFRYEKFKAWLATSQATTIQEAKNEAQSAGVGVEAFNFDFGSSSASSNYQQWKSSFLSSNFAEVAEQASYRNVLRTTNEALVNAFERCVNKRFGTSIWIDASSDTEFAIFHQFVPPTGSNDTSVNVKSFTVTNATCEPELRKIRKIGPVSSVQCRKSNADAVAAVSLSTDEYGPRIQPKFAPIKTPAAPAGVTLAGSINGYATRLSQHSLVFPIAGTPSAADLAKAVQGQPFTWRVTVQKEIDEYDFVETPQISATSAGPFNACSIANTSAEKKGKALTIMVESTCKMLTNISLGGGSGIHPSAPLPFPRFLIQKQSLASNGFNFSANIALVQRLPVQAGAKQIFEANSPRSSWSFPYDVTRDPALAWTYAFDVEVVSGGSKYRLFRSPDGRQQQLTAGPFRAVFGDDQKLTIFRDNSGESIPLPVAINAPAGVAASPLAHSSRVKF